MNKVDKVKKPEKVEENLLSYKTLFEENLPVVRISAKTGRNIDTLMNNIFKNFQKVKRCTQKMLLQKKQCVM